MDPATIISLIGGVGSLFGGGGMNADQRRALHQQQQISQRLLQYATGVPGSDPGEQAALAQQQAQLGEQQLQQKNQLLATLGVNQGMQATPDFLQNLSSLQTAQRMGVDMSHLQNALMQRRQALLDASNVGMNAANLANQQGPPNMLPQYFGQLAQAISQSQAYKKQKGAGVTGLGPQGKIPGASPAATAAAGYNASQASKDLVAPGNEPFGLNAQYNMMRQPVLGSNTSSDLWRQGLERLITTPGGLKFG